MNTLLPWRQLPNLPTEHLNNLTWQFRAFAYLTIVQLNIYLIEPWAIEHLSIQHRFKEFRKWSQLPKYIIEQCTIEQLIFTNYLLNCAINQCLIARFRKSEYDGGQHWEEHEGVSQVLLGDHISRIFFRPVSLQGVPCPRGLGFVDLDLGCSTILLRQ